MRSAMAAAKRDNRLASLAYDETTLRIDNSRLRGPDSLKGCIVNEPDDRPSDIILRAQSELLYLEDQKDTADVIELVKKDFQ